MLDLINILSLAGWIYFFYAVVDYLGNKFLNLRLFKPRGILKEILIIHLGFIIFALLGLIEMGIRKTDPNAYGLFGYLFALMWLGFLSTPLLYFYSLAFLLLILKIYQCVFLKSQKSKIVKAIGLLVSIIFISFNLGITDYRVVLCQLNYKNICGTITAIGNDTKKICAEKIALENNEFELCKKFGDPSECYYNLGVKTNDKSFCKKIEEEGEYEFFAADCYYKIALNKKDLSLCKKSGEHLRHCAASIMNVSDITKSAIEAGKSRLCFQEYDQEKKDRCHYDFVKLYYYDTNLYENLNCSGGSRVVCSWRYNLVITDEEIEKKKYSKELFIKLCDNIKDKNLREECYKFEK